MSSSLSSSTSATESTTSPSSTATDSGGSSEPTSLYLFTFLATLFLLLFVSAAIVLRSYILRRRFRRRMEEVIVAGVLLTPPSGTPRRKLEKPTLWDAVLAPAANEEWGNVMPVAASMCTTRRSRGNDTSDPAEQDEAFAQWTPLRIFRRPFARRRATSSPLLSSPDPSLPQHLSTSPSVAAAEDATDQRASEVQVSLLVVMPNPHRSAYTTDTAGQWISMKGKERSSASYWDEDEEGVPDLVLGVARVPCRGPGGGE